MPKPHPSRRDVRALAELRGEREAAERAAQEHAGASTGAADAGSGPSATAGALPPDTSDIETWAAAKRAQWEAARRAEADRQTAERAERDAARRAERATTERAAAERAEAERVAAERAAAEREVAERAAREAAEQEAAERAAQDAAERAERAAAEKTEREAASRAAENAREAAERATAEQAAHERAAHERAAREAARSAGLDTAELAQWTAAKRAQWNAVELESWASQKRAEWEAARREREEQERERAEQEAHERAEQAERERAEREEQERAERRAREREEREARERAELEQREQLERREQQERETREHEQRERERRALEFEALERARREQQARAEREARETAENEAREREARQREDRERAAREERERDPRPATTPVSAATTSADADDADDDADLWVATTFARPVPAAARTPHHPADTADTTDTTDTTDDHADDDAASDLTSPLVGTAAFTVPAFGSSQPLDTSLRAALFTASDIDARGGSSLSRDANALFANATESTALTGFDDDLADGRFLAVPPAMPAGPNAAPWASARWEALAQRIPLARRVAPRTLAIGTAVLAVAAIAVVTVVAITGAFSARDSSTADVPPPQDSSAPLRSDATPEAPLPTAGALDAPVIESAAPAVTCDDPAVIAALAEGTDADVIAAFGGGGPFRARVASGEAPCVNLTEPGRTWIVVNKQFGITEPGYLPELVYAEGARNTVDGELRADVDAALAEMNAASIAEGAGELGIASAARADWFQQRLHDNDAASNGLESADESTARAGHSEHQTGLAVDLIACDGGCGTIEGFGDSPQGRWVAVNAWRFGFIVRYEDGFTGTTGYMPEPWHLRYIGLELAHAYAEGGYRTLEDFFGLPAAPDYVD